MGKIVKTKRNALLFVLMSGPELPLKKRHLNPRYQVGDVLNGFNEGPGGFYLYKNVVQPARITKVPEHPGGEYEGVILGFEDGMGSWREEALSRNSHYRYGPTDLKKGDYIEFKMQHRYDSDGDVISDVPGTWVSGKVVEKMGQCHYRVIRTLWSHDDQSREATFDVCYIEHTRTQK